MDPVKPFTEILLAGTVSGLIITCIVTYAFHLIWKNSGFNISPVRAIGDALSDKGYRNSGLASLAVHLLIGSFLGVIYFALLSKLGLPPLQSILASTAIGFGHGFVVSFLIFNSLNEKASNSEVRDHSPAISIIYLVAHLIFGFVIGALYSSLMF